jgi:hypothetical protein
MKKLVVTDRATGAREIIPENDDRYGESIVSGARSAGMSPVEALRILEEGGEIVTCGFIRKLAMFATVSQKDIVRALHTE